MPRLLLLIALLLAPASFLRAQQSYTLAGCVRDLFTENGIDSASVVLKDARGRELCRAMATVPYLTETNSMGVTLNRKSPKEGAGFTLTVNAPETYTLSFTKPGYEPTEQQVTIKAGDHKKTIQLGDIYMAEKSKQLREAEVKGTKIRMFYKGDTLIYNASAFMLPDGSMLDDLVKQLPSAELRDGNIYVQGRLVENLLLGGKDFFNGNPQAALRNLPAYVVGRIKMYEKAGELSQLTGSDMDDRSYVMDVHLKRQYIGTFLGQLKAGYGTHDRYEGGLFAMRFDDRQSFSISGDFNNLNADNEYGQNNITRGYGSGLRKRNFGTADYRFEPNGKVKLTANLSVIHRDMRLTSGRAGETYLSGGNTYDRMLNHNHDKSFGTDGNARLLLRPRQGRLYEMGYSGNYTHNDNTADSRSAAYSSDPLTGDTSTLLDGTFAGQGGSPSLRGIILHRLRNDVLSEEHASRHQVTARSSHAFGDNVLDLNGSYSLNQSTSDRFDRYDLQYPGGTRPQDFRNRFTNHESKRYSYQLQGKFLWTYVSNDRARGLLTPSYQYIQTYQSAHQPLYRLDQLGGAWGAEGEAVLGSLPSAYEELLKPETDNSYSSTQRTFRHTTGLEWTHDLKLATGGWLELKAAAQAIHELGRLVYHRYNRRYDTKRSTWLLNPTASLRWRPMKGDKGGNKLTLRLLYNSRASQPYLYYLIGITDASDPLNVSLGNSSLKNTRFHQATANLSRNWLLKGISLSTSLSYLRWHNQVAMEQTYDRSTGVRTTRPIGVDGNYILGYNLWCNVPLDKQQKLNMQASMGTSYAHSMDLSLVEGQTASARYRVSTVSLSPSLGMNYRPAGSTYLTGSITMSWQGVKGERPDFVSIHATDLTYKLGVQSTLPGRIQLFTDFRAISRYGYNDAALNDTRIVWSLGLSRSVGDWIFSLKGNDLLGRNRYTSISINAQGRTETWSNTLPRYFLASITWRFNKVARPRQPKSTVVR